ncbi:MAG: hypothetical protein EZS28_037838 [Streblomastix strix]|uniref:Uncharacterized protein n=1 Tax=Streblomastix strix TaxID=222440 RepID=A0A5J4UAE4_9EUKA|nr:MAG: hypothetical protein EZS28_037838 [Streblomastix strix]
MAYSINNDIGLDRYERVQTEQSLGWAVIDADPEEVLIDISECEFKSVKNTLQEIEISYGTPRILLFDSQYQSQGIIDNERNPGLIELHLLQNKKLEECNDVIGINRIFDDRNGGESIGGLVPPHVQWLVGRCLYKELESALAGVERTIDRILGLTDKEEQEQQEKERILEEQKQEMDKQETIGEENENENQDDENDKNKDGQNESQNQDVPKRGRKKSKSPPKDKRGKSKEQIMNQNKKKKKKKQIIKQYPSEPPKNLVQRKALQLRMIEEDVIQERIKWEQTILESLTKEDKIGRKKRGRIKKKINEQEEQEQEQDQEQEQEQNEQEQEQGQDGYGGYGDEEEDGSYKRRKKLNKGKQKQKKRKRKVLYQADENEQQMNSQDQSQEDNETDPSQNMSNIGDIYDEEIKQQTREQRRKKKMKEKSQFYEEWEWQGSQLIDNRMKKRLNEGEEEEEEEGIRKKKKRKKGGQDDEDEGDVIKIQKQEIPVLQNINEDIWIMKKMWNEKRLRNIIVERILQQEILF